MTSNIIFCLNYQPECYSIIQGKIVTNGSPKSLKSQTNNIEEKKVD